MPKRNWHISYKTKEKTMKELFQDRTGGVYQSIGGARFEVGKIDPLNNTIQDQFGSTVGHINPLTNTATLGSSNNGYFVPNNPFEPVGLKKDFR
jgi:hypothetical protein